MNTEFNTEAAILQEMEFHQVSMVQSNFLLMFKQRKMNIEETQNRNKYLESRRTTDFLHESIRLKNTLMEIGYFLEFEIDNLVGSKRNVADLFGTSWIEKLNEEIMTINASESALFEEATAKYKIFLNRWKILRKDKFVKEVQTKLKEEAFVDPVSRYEILAELKEKQERVANSRKESLNLLFGCQIKDLTVKFVSNKSKEFDDLYEDFQETLDVYTAKLVENGEELEKVANKIKEEMKRKIQNLQLDFDSGDSVENIIDQEISPLTEEARNYRKQLSLNIFNYLDAYEEFTSAVINKILNIFKAIAEFNDKKKIELRYDDKMYLLELAKLGDNDEEFIESKEKELSAVLDEMREAIDVEETEEKLVKAFGIVLELEQQYRRFFKESEMIMNKHGEIIKNGYRQLEQGLVSNFLTLDESRIKEINRKRTIESIYMTQRKAFLAELEEMTKTQQSKDDKKKKTVKKDKKKESEAVKIREITTFSTKINAVYCEDMSPLELVKKFFREVYFRREDKVIMPKLEEEKKQKKAKKGEPEEETDLYEDLYEEGEIDATYCPYEAVPDQTFYSPVSLKGSKFLSEINFLTETTLTSNFYKMRDEIFKYIYAKVKEKIEIANTEDTERREEYLEELDIRLKSIAPRKGKIEVEVFDVRVEQIAKHKEKYTLQIMKVIERNEADENEFNSLMLAFTQEFDKLDELYVGLDAGIGAEESVEGLETKFKRFKSSFYDFNSFIEDKKLTLKRLIETNPQHLMKINNNFADSMMTFVNNGTYSEKEVVFYKMQIEAKNEELLRKEIKKRETISADKLKLLKEKASFYMISIEKKYNDRLIYLQAKNCKGKKFGITKIIANDIIFKIKLKCNLAFEGVSKLFDELKQSAAKTFDDSDFDEDAYNLKVRRLISKLNNCIYFYGSYLEAFIEGFSYELKRVKEDEVAQEIEIEQVTKEEEIKIEQEQTALGFIVDSNGSKYQKEILLIEDRLKSECSKIYVGEHSKLLDPQLKMPKSLFVFLEKLKKDMATFRIKSIKDLKQLVGF